MRVSWLYYLVLLLESGACQGHPSIQKMKWLSLQRHRCWATAMLATVGSSGIGTIIIFTQTGICSVEFLGVVAYLHLWHCGRPEAYFFLHGIVTKRARCLT